MPEITLDLPASLLDEFERHARRHNVETTHVILETLRAHAPRDVQRRRSLRDLRPLELGRVVVPLTNEDDLLEEMLDG